MSNVPPLRRDFIACCLANSLYLFSSAATRKIRAEAGAGDAFYELLINVPKDYEEVKGVSSGFVIFKETTESAVETEEE